VDRLVPGTRNQLRDGADEAAASRTGLAIMTAVPLFMEKIDFF